MFFDKIYEKLDSGLKEIRHLGVLSSIRDTKNTELLTEISDSLHFLQQEMSGAKKEVQSLQMVISDLKNSLSSNVDKKESISFESETLI